MKLLNKPALAAILAGALLAACGGGGGAGGAASAVSGVAATGAAIAGGSVTLKCATGTTGSVTTGADGSYSVDVSGVTLPCVARVAFKDGAGTAQKLHSFVSSIGIANITPVTELLVANLTSGTAVNAFDNFNATAVKALTAAQIKTAAAAVKAYLKNTLGVDTTNLPDDPIGTKFVAKAGSVLGDAFDKVLDELQSKLQLSGKTLTVAAAEVSAAGGGGSGVGGSALGTLTVSEASNTARNGTYTPTVGGKFVHGTDVALNAISADGKFEYEVVYSSVNGAILRAHIWFKAAIDAPPIFFGCDGGRSIACTGVGYEPLMKQVLFNSSVQFSQVNPSLDGSGADALVGGGETLKVQGTLDAN